MSNEAASTSVKTLEGPSEEQIGRVKEKISAVRNRIKSAAKGAQRVDEPRLVAISKLHPPSSILAAVQHGNPGQLHFGENYAQELEAKARILPRSIRWHFVGKLQSNKANRLAAIPNLYLLETLDSIKLANALEKARGGSVNHTEQKQEPLGVFLQINTSGEESKSGLSPMLADGDDGGKGEVFKLAAHVMSECKMLRLRGLMTIGAAANSASQEGGGVGGRPEQDAELIATQARSANPDFDTLYRTRHVLVKALQKHFTDETTLKERYADLLRPDSATGGLELSMGMSSDLEVAIRAGSDNVRVGTDCFGARPSSREEAMAAMKDELESEPYAA